jgi:hypothetical protein
MKKLVFFVFFIPLFALTNLCYNSEVDYSAFDSIEEVIESETSIISNTPSYEHEMLSDAYASRGESFLICHRFEEALEDFQRSYQLGIRIKNGDVSRSLLFRALFGQALVYGHLDMPEKVYPIVDLLEDIIQSFRCSECSEKISSDSNINLSHPPRIIFCEDVPIYGPDKISIKDCHDFVTNTVKLAKLLICNVTSSRIRGVLTLTIEQLADEAHGCCSRGGIWKGCVQKLANKFHLWNQKWQLFNIPPDPAWD